MRLTSAVITLVFTLALFGVSGNADAWNDKGHMAETLPFS